MAQSQDPEISSNQELRACPICGEREAGSSSFSARSWAVGVCKSCGMIYLRNPPLQDSLGVDFAWEKTKLKERSRRRKDRKIYYFFSDGIKKIRAFIRRGKRKEVGLVNRMRPEGGNILDIGCASGGTLRPLQGGHWKLFGIEPSPNFALRANDICVATGGFALQNTALEGLPQFNPNFFDVVMMRSFLEHDCYAAETLRAVHQVLKEGGFVVIKVPNAACWNARLRGDGWPGVRHPDHVNYFTPRHLLRIISDAGFFDVRFPLGWRLPTSDNMWMVAYKSTSL